MQTAKNTFWNCIAVGDERMAANTVCNAGKYFDLLTCSTGESENQTLR